MTVSSGSAVAVLDLDASPIMDAGLADRLPPLARSPEIYALVMRADGRAWRANLDAARGVPAEQLELLWRIDCFAKPVVSLIGRALSEGELGCALFGTHRVAGEGCRVAIQAGVSTLGHQAEPRVGAGGQKKLGVDLFVEQVERQRAIGTSGQPGMNLPMEQIFVADRVQCDRTLKVTNHAD